MATCYEELKAIQKRYGRSEYDRQVKKINRERLENAENRPKRKPLSPGQRKNLYAKQSGICACGCNEPMTFGEASDDHFDPNAGENFNDIRNRRLVKRGHNSRKGANSVYDEAKRLNVTVTELLKKQVELHE